MPFFVDIREMNSEKYFVPVLISDKGRTILMRDGVSSRHLDGTAGRSVDPALLPAEHGNRRNQPSVSLNLLDENPHFFCVDEFESKESEESKEVSFRRARVSGWKENVTDLLNQLMISIRMQMSGSTYYRKRKKSKYFAMTAVYLPPSDEASIRTLAIFARSLQGYGTNKEGTICLHASS